MVVIKGLAITAGSKPRRLANRGSVQPTNLARMTVTQSVRHTTPLTSRLMLSLPISSRSTSRIFRKQAAASAAPQSTAARASFHITRNRSEKCSSSRLRARMTVTED